MLGEDCSQALTCWKGCTKPVQTQFSEYKTSENQSIRPKKVFFIPHIFLKQNQNGSDGFCDVLSRESVRFSKIKVICKLYEFSSC